jgi:hypothetical protein
MITQRENSTFRTDEEYEENMTVQLQEFLTMLSMETVEGYEGSMEDVEGEHSIVDGSTRVDQENDNRQPTSSTITDPGERARARSYDVADIPTLPTSVPTARLVPTAEEVVDLDDIPDGLGSFRFATAEVDTLTEIVDVPYVPVVHAKRSRMCSVQ